MVTELVPILDLTLVTGGLEMKLYLQDDSVDQHVFVGVELFSIIILCSNLRSGEFSTFRQLGVLKRLERFVVSTFWLALLEVRSCRIASNQYMEKHCRF